MAYIIRANNKNYTVSVHAAKRMIQRFIPEEIVIETLENGTIVEQAHGTDLYEHSIFDPTLEDKIIVRVIVDETTRTIVSVIDDNETE